MTTKLVRWSWVLVLPVSAVLAAPAERAVEVPLNSTSRQTTVTSHKGKTAARQVTPVRERTLSMRDTAPAGSGDDAVYHSIHDWVPRTPTKASQTQAQAQSTGARKSNKKHWWSRPQRDASKQQAEEVTR